MSRKKTKSRRGPGRPEGPAEEVDVAAATVVRCKRCDSTRRSKYTNTRILRRGGTGPDGKPYTRVVWRRCRCLSCGQARVERTFENHAGEVD